MSTKISALTASNSIDAANDYVPIVQSSVTKKISRNTLLGLASAPLGTTDSQSPTNKTFDNTNTYTIKDGSLTLQNTGSLTRQATFSLSGITAGQTRIMTLPDANATLVGTATTQTLTNKTLTSPTITGGTIDNSTITVDAITGHTVGTTVTVANLQIANGVLNTANAVTATSIAVGAVQPQALVTGTGSGWAFQSYTPTPTNFSVGNGTMTAGYCQIGKAVFVRFQLVFGTTTSVSGAFTFTLPVTSVSTYKTSSPLGSASFNGAGFNPCVALWNSTTTVQIWAVNASGTYTTYATTSATIPSALSNGSDVTAEFFYEAA